MTQYRVGGFIHRRWWSKERASFRASAVDPTLLIDESPKEALGAVGMTTPDSLWERT